MKSFTSEDIKIEYVQPKSEQHDGADSNRISRTKIVTERDLQSAGINFETKIDIDEDTKANFAIINRELSSNNGSEDHQSLSLPQTFDCNQCSAKYVKTDALERHMKIHTNSKAYTCDYCSKSFSRRNCIRHMKAVHMKKGYKSYECYVCNSKYEKLSFLKYHMVVHFEGKTLECEICSKKFAFQSSLTKHIRSTHDIKDIRTKRASSKYHCEDCPFQTANLDHLRSHVRKNHAIEVLGPSEVISCKICSKTFSKNANFRQHMRIHIKLYKCNSCQKSFPNQHTLNRHSAVHSSIQPTCPICDHKVKRFSTLKRHMRVHNSEKNFKCQICLKAFSLQLNLEKHLLRHVIGKRYQCYMCTFSSKTLAKLKFHFTKHVGKKIFKCKVCFKRFLQEDCWKNHVSQHISGTFSCKLCPRTYLYSETLKRHVSRHNLTFACTICSKVYRGKTGLDRHTRSIHNADTTEKKFECEVCSKKFFEKFSMTQHVESVHRLDKSKEIEYRCTICPFVTHLKHRLKRHSSRHITERLYVCDQCPNTFKTSACLTKHIKGCHNKDPKIYTCNICFQTFDDRSSRLKHKRVHVEKRIHKCSICSFEAKTEFKLLKVHMNVHTQPFKCKICLRKFSTKGNLSRHQKTHGLMANGRPDNKIKYECYICGHFAKNGEKTLRIHFSKHTGEKLFKCSVCTSSFSRPDYLRIHLRIHTGTVE